MTPTMTANERRLLRYHNVIFEKQANGAHIYGDGSLRFYVTYADGKIKHDYECGSWSQAIRNHVVDFQNKE